MPINKKQKQQTLESLEARLNYTLDTVTGKIALAKFIEYRGQSGDPRGVSAFGYKVSHDNRPSSMLAILIDPTGTWCFGHDSVRLVEAKFRAIEDELSTAENPIQVIESSLAYCHSEIAQKLDYKDEDSVFGAVQITVLWLNQEKSTILNCGTNRVYLADKDDIQTLIRGDLLIFELLDAGKITSGEVSDHPLRHVLTNALGSHAELQTKIKSFLWRSGDRLLIQSKNASELLLDTISADPKYAKLPASEIETYLETLWLESSPRIATGMIIIDLA